MAILPESGPLRACLIYSGGFFGCSAILVAIAVIITVLASIRTLGPEEQVLVHFWDGKEVTNGPCTKVFHPFREKEWRTAIRFGNLQYIRIRNVLNGDVRMVAGHAKVFLGAYEEADGVQNKIVLTKTEYIRLVDRLSGVERIVYGPDSIMPGPWEESADGVQQAAFVSQDEAALILNRATGAQRLHSTIGPFFPSPYEVVTEMRPRIRVLPHETMVVRNAYGSYVVHKGTDANPSFFLGPFEQVVQMEWSFFSEPAENGIQLVSSIPVTRMDMRTRRLFFQHDTRTNDNVAMRIEGSIFWQISDVMKLLSITADPSGDVWYKARSTFISAVSKVDLEEFMAGFNRIIQDAFDAQADDPFYSDRGIAVKSIEVTKYSPTDPATAATLQEIIEVTTNRINQLQEQRSRNDVAAARLAADIQLEQKKLELINQQATNERLEAARAGEAEGVEMAKSASTFIDDLSSSLPDVDERLALYKFHKKLENQNERTKSLASGRATLFMTADELNFNLQTSEL